MLFLAYLTLIGENMMLKWVFDGGLWSVPAAGGHGHVPVNGAVWGVSSWWRRSSAGRVVTPVVWQAEFLQHSKTGWMSFQKAETNCELRNLLWQCECLCHDARFCRQRHERCGVRIQRKSFIDDNCCFCLAKYEHISILVFQNHKGKPYSATTCAVNREEVFMSRSERLGLLSPHLTPSWERFNCVIKVHNVIVWFVPCGFV